jgi:phage protein D
MRPVFKVLANGQDITALLADRLESLQVVDKAGLDSDELTITLDDRDGAVALPARGAVLEVSLGYAETGLTRIGRYRVDEVKSSGPPQQVSFSGRPADMSGQIKQVRRGAWEAVSLERIVQAVAARNQLQAVCKVKATVARADQMNESDLHFITRLARQYDATATVKGGKLLVLPRGGQAQSVSGKVLPTMVLQRRDITSWQFTASDRNASGGAVVRHHDQATGRTRSVRVAGADGSAAPAQVVRHAAASPGTAAAQAKAAGARAYRSEVTMNLVLPGRADIVAERTLRTQGIKDGVDHLWTVDSVTHEFSSAGWALRVDLVLNKKAVTAKGKKKGRKPKPPLKVLTP